MSKKQTEKPTKKWVNHFVPNGAKITVPGEHTKKGAMIAAALKKGINGISPKEAVATYTKISNAQKAADATYTMGWYGTSFVGTNGFGVQKLYGQLGMSDPQQRIRLTIPKSTKETIRGTTRV